jgi:hypothetical protein
MGDNFGVIMGIIVDADPLTNIDRIESQGLTGTHDSLGYRVGELERHIHSNGRWFEPAVVPVGETHVADRISENGGVGFQIDAGNDDWGAWLQVIGSEDTPVIAGCLKFDINRIFISAVERASIYYVQLGFGATGAAALVAEEYSEFVYKPATVQATETALVMQGRRHDVGTKAWARCMCPGQNTATLSFFIGVHEYEG